METLGTWLRQTRDAKGGTLEEAEVSTCIRGRFLEALEAGDFAIFLGGEAQIRGFLRIYARYLELSPGEVLARYDAEVRADKLHPGVEVAPPGVSAEMQPDSPARLATGPAAFQPRNIPVSAFPLRRVNLKTLIIASIVFVVLLVAVAAIGYSMSQNAAEEAAANVAFAAATATAPAETPLTSVPTVTVTSIPPAVTPTFPVSSQGDVMMTLEATEHVWVRVTTDGLIVFEGLLARGQVETWVGQEAVIVDSGNGAGVLITVNGQPQGAMCGRGQVCSRAWGPAGEIAVPSLAPTSTP